MFLHRGVQALHLRHVEISSGGRHIWNVIFGGVNYPTRVLIFHEQRTTIDLQVHAEFAHGSVKNFLDVECAADSLRDAIDQRGAIGLPRQHILDLLPLGNITGHALDADRLAVAKY